MGVSRVVVQCGAVAGVLEGCLGPHGRAVLLEKAGCIIITQDGSELLSTLEIGDPLLNKVVQMVVEQTQVLGDGCKVTILLLRHLLASLDTCLPHSLTMQVSRRQKLIQITKFIQKTVLWRLQRDVINLGAQVYPLRSFEAVTHILHSTAEDLFRTKFSKFIAKNLAKLFSSYISSECSSSGELLKLLDHLAVHTHTAIIEVFHMPLVRSHVVSGFVITRRFRHLNKGMKFDNVPCILWSIELEQKREHGSQVRDVIETRCGETLVESIVSTRNCLERCLKLLVSHRTKLILSSICFPDWGTAMCVKYGISLIDGIDSEEWKLLDVKLKLQPVVREEDITPQAIGTLERIEPLHIGTCDYVKLTNHGGHQMILCGPTVTQCRQFSKAYVQLFKYLSAWVADCLDFYHNNSVSETESDGSEDEYNAHTGTKDPRREHRSHPKFQDFDFEYAQHSGFMNGNIEVYSSGENLMTGSYHEDIPGGYGMRGPMNYGSSNPIGEVPSLENTYSRKFSHTGSVTSPTSTERTYVLSDGAGSSVQYTSSRKFSYTGSTTSQASTRHRHMLSDGARASDMNGSRSSSEKFSYSVSAPNTPREHMLDARYHNNNGSTRICTSTEPTSTRDYDFNESKIYANNVHYNYSGSVSHLPTQNTNKWFPNYSDHTSKHYYNTHTGYTSTEHTGNQTHRYSVYSSPQDTHHHEYQLYPSFTFMSSSSSSCSSYGVPSEPCDPRLGGVMYAVPHGGFVELLAKYLVTENISLHITDDTTRAIVLSLLNEIPWQLHRKVSYSQKSYLEFQTKLFGHFRDLRTRGQKFIQPQVTQGSHFSGYQSPFMLFKILDRVLHFAEYILRIECIIPSKLRISKFIQSSKDDEDSGDDDD